jgi:cytochrome c biogenesis factor
MAVYTDWLRAEDVDVIADHINADGTIFFKVLVKPLVNLIWLAGFVFLLGSIVAMWPDPREHRRLAARYALQT